MTNAEHNKRRPSWRRASVAGVLLLAAIGLAVAFLFRGERGPRVFASAVRGAGEVVLHEGLPHPMWERELLQRERETKPVRELHGYPFYRETLPLREDEARKITETLAAPAMYAPFSGEKKCGGFHPDYAVEWRRGEDVHLALLCFGCEEVMLFGPGIESRHDLRNAKAVQEVLASHHKNRPVHDGGP